MSRRKRRRQSLIRAADGIYRANEHPLIYFPAYLKAYVLDVRYVDVRLKDVINPIVAFLFRKLIDKGYGDDINADLDFEEGVESGYEHTVKVITDAGRFTVRVHSAENSRFSGDFLLQTKDFFNHLLAMAREGCVPFREHLTAFGIHPQQFRDEKVFRVVLAYYEQYKKRRSVWRKLRRCRIPVCADLVDYAVGEIGEHIPMLH